MKPLQPIERRYWEQYLSNLEQSNRSVSFRVEASYAGSRDTTDKLIELYLCGKKTAGSSIAEDFISSQDKLPQVGNFWIVLNSKNEPSCILKTEQVVFNKFKNVTSEIAIAEGEGDLSLEYWKRVHTQFYLPHLPKWGVSKIEEATVITEYFRLVYK